MTSCVSIAELQCLNFPLQMVHANLSRHGSILLTTLELSHEKILQDAVLPAIQVKEQKSFLFGLSQTTVNDMEFIGRRLRMSLRKR